MASGQYENVEIKRESEFEVFNYEKYDAVQQNTEDVDFTDLSRIKCKTEIHNDCDIDIHYEYIKTEIDEKKPEKCGDGDSIRRVNFTQIKREKDCNVFDEVFDRREIKYVPSQFVPFSEHGKFGESSSESNLIDQRKAYAKYEEQDEEKYAVVELNTMDVDFTYFSTSQYTSEQIKSEVDGDIHSGDVETEYVEKKLGKTRRYSGKEALNCKICSKAFSQSSSLKAHQRIHTGERPFHCKICSKAFTQLTILQVHERMHTGEKPFHCKTCSKAFSKLSNLKDHEKIHTGDRHLQCKICSKAFNYLSHLNVHERIHTGEKPFHCKICSKAFTQLGNLKQHEKIHTPQK